MGDAVGPDEFKEKRRGGIRQGAGRPAKLSRDLILDAASGLLESEPNSPLTVKAVATSLGVTPMALYRHFQDRAALVDAVVDRVFRGLQLGDFSDRAWDEAAATWMHDVRSHVRRYPQILELLIENHRYTPAWIRSIAVLARALERGGFDSEARGVAVGFIVRVCVSVVLAEIRAPLRSTPDAVFASMTEFDAPRRTEVLDAFGEYCFDEDLYFEMAVAGTLDAVRDMRSKRSANA